jgi:SRSO17 transposase
VTIGRKAKETVKFVDEYCEQYRGLFSDARSFEYFKGLHIGLISDVPRKSLPALAKVVGEGDSQGLHHFVAHGNWDVEALREKRLALLRQALGERRFVLCIDETGDKKKGTTTDYTARQYIGNLGKLENGVVSVNVNAYGVLDNVTFPLLFKIFKPDKRLKAGDVYASKPRLALALIGELRQRGFQFDLVLADRLYGESGDFISALMESGLRFVVAIRDNHTVWVQRGTRQRQTRWRSFERVFSDGTTQTRYVSETVFGKRTPVRYFRLTTDPITLPKDTTYLVMTNLTGNVRHTLGNSYGLRTWIEYGFKHIKNELGWADYRLTDYAAIEH